MTIQIIPPTADNTLTNWSRVGAGTSFGCLVSDDGDTTYIDDNDLGGAVLVTGDAGIMPPGEISQVLVRITSRSTAAFQSEGTNRRFRINATNYDTAFGATVSETYVTYAIGTATTNPDTGVAWITEDINTPLIWGMSRTSTTGPGHRYTKAQLEVTYIPDEGSFVQGVASLGPIVAVSLEMIPKLAALMRDFRRTVLDVEDQRRLLDAFRTARWPRYVFMAS